MRSFELSFAVGDDAAAGASSTEGAAKKGRVTLQLLYFPYEGGTETAPDPPQSFHTCGLGGKPHVSPLETFWLGRLLPGQAVAPFKFMLPSAALKSKASLPAQCWKRFRGALFLDESFEVVSTKRALAAKSPLTAKLLGLESTRVAERFLKWLSECQHRRQLGVH